MTWDEILDFSAFRKLGRWVGACTAVLSLIGWAAVAISQFLAASGDMDSVAMALLAMVVAATAFAGSLRGRAFWLLMAGSWGFVSASTLSGVAAPLQLVGYLAIGYLVAAILLWKPGSTDFS